MGKFKQRILFRLRKWQQPVMVGNYKRYDGKKLPLTRVSTSTVIQGAERFDVANNVFIGHFNFIDATFGLKIEEGCQITNYVSLLTHSSHDAIRLYGAHYGKVGQMQAYNEGEVVIGKYTFIGPHTVVMPNSKIGKGSLIAAYSFVQGDFPDFSIIAGNPAKVVGDTRKKDETLLEKHPELRQYYNEWAE
ncbi:MAG: acyltransferase [bacterium]|nr:acyltransferase [bacterium]